MKTGKIEVSNHRPRSANATRSWKRKEMESPLEKVTDTLVLGFCLAELIQKKFLLF